jgi:hypothetical protein
MSQPEQRIAFSPAVLEDLDEFFDTLPHGQVKRIKAKLQADARPVSMTANEPPASTDKEPAAAPAKADPAPPAEQKD